MPIQYTSPLDLPLLIVNNTLYWFVLQVIIPEAW